MAANVIPLVDYLELEPTPRLVANECCACGARYFDHRHACARCFATDFRRVPVATTGTLTAFTIVHSAAPDVAVPFVAGVVDCDGTAVLGNIVAADADPTSIRSGMKVRLVTEVVGRDEHGVEAVGFAFRPAD